MTKDGAMVGSFDKREFSVKKISKQQNNAGMVVASTESRRTGRNVLPPVPVACVQARQRAPAVWPANCSGGTLSKASAPGMVAAAIMAKQHIPSEQFPFGPIDNQE